MEYSKYLYELNNHIWLGYLLALVAVYALKLGSRSYFIGALVTIIMSFVMMVIEPQLVDLAQNYPEFVKHAWYTTWAVCNIIGAVLIYKIHTHEGLKISFVSMSFILGMVFMCLVQSFRYLDLVVLQLNLMGAGLKITVNTINLGYLVFLSAPLIAALKLRMSKAAV